MSSIAAQTTQPPDGLPPARTEPIGWASDVLAALAWRHRRAAESLCGDAPVMLMTRSGTRVDVGLWLRTCRTWVCCLPDRLVLFAGGRRPYAEEIRYAELSESLYNHVTGELMLSPADGARVRRLKLPPSEAYQILAEIHHHEEDQDA